MRPGEFKQPIARPKKRDPEDNIWFWNPNRVGVRFAPPSFMEKLKEVGDELSCVWNPRIERWQVYARAERIQHPICHGWKLLFVHNGPDGAYLPLDERVFARLYAASAMEHGSARVYFDRLMAEQERDKERRDKANLQDTLDIAMPHWEHSQISVAMTGKSNGSKFSTYHS